MFWADRIASEVEKRFQKNGGRPLLVRDEKTVSGRVHVGSMRGVVIHGSVSNALRERGVANVFKYEFNDFDPMDDIPSYLPHAEFEQYLGLSLNKVPSPAAYLSAGAADTAHSFAEYFANDFKSVILDTGYTPEFYYASELYTSSKMDGMIREALTSADTISRIYKEVSGSQRSDGWLPISVVCPTCSKILTTEASEFDGETVMVHCREDKVAFAKGCGFSGRVSPFGGGAKLAWKVEWAAKWKVLGVAIEGGGKDHSTKGGSRDVANHISREVFHYEPPFDIPYEFFLVGGKKMSSSKGRGSSAREIADLVPPKIFRLAMLSKDINQAVNFDPEGDTIPVLYDLYDKLAEGYKTGVVDDYVRLFEAVHSGKPDVPEFLPRFSQVAFLVQMPHLSIEQEFARIKGAALTAGDTAELAERATYARKWLELCAPEKFVFKLQDTLPEVAASLTEVQKNALRALVDFIAGETAMPSGEVLQQKLHEIKESHDIAPGDLFGALYLSFLGKSYGPKVGWFLSVLDRDFVSTRLREASA